MAFFMKIIIYKSITYSIVLLLFISFNARAEYYVVYSQPEVIYLSSHYKKKVSCHHKHRKHKPIHRKKHSSASISVYYVYPRAGCCNYCGWNAGCERWYPAPRYYVTEEVYYPRRYVYEEDYYYDMSTGDDDARFDPNLNIDR